MKKYHCKNVTKYQDGTRCYQLIDSAGVKHTVFEDVAGKRFFYSYPIQDKMKVDAAIDWFMWGRQSVLFIVLVCLAGTFALWVLL